MLGTYALKLKKGRSGKSRRQESISFASKDQKVQFYLFTHHKIKNQYRNGEFKNVCDMLFNMEPPEQKQLPLFYEDQLTSLNKFLKHLIQRKELGSDNASHCIRKGKEVIYKFYDIFLRDESLQNSTKSVNTDLSNSMTRFLNVFCCFLMYYCCFCSRQGLNDQSSVVYEVFYSVLRKIVTSSTYNYKILKKAGQGLLLYASWLVECSNLEKALEVYFIALRNEINILLIVAYRIKKLGKHDSKRLVFKIYNRLLVLMFNLGQVYQMQGKIHLTSICFRECLIITNFKNRILEKDIKNNLLDYLKHYQLFHQQHLQLSHITSSYFSQKEIKSNHHFTHSKLHPQANFEQEKISSFPTGILSHQTGASLTANELKIDTNNKQKRLLKKSYSIQDKLSYNTSSKQPLTTEMLFYGVKLFNKMEAKSRPKSLTTQNSLFISHNQLASQPNHKAYSKAPTSKLVKKTRKHEFRQEKEHIDYSILQKRFAKLWNQDQVEVNRIKQKVCLLNYKSQNSSYNAIYKESSNVFLQIQPSLKKNINANASKKPLSKRLNHQSQLSDTDAGINLFKNILLKNNKLLGLRRIETLAILRRKTNYSIPGMIQDYSQAQESVNFLRKKLDFTKERGEVRKSQERPEGVNRNSIEAVFLTKDTVETPNLFLSYITRSSSFSLEILQAILRYGLLLIKINNAF